MNFHESVAERSGERFPSTVCARWVLRCKEAKKWVGLNDFLGFRDEKLPVIVEEAVQRLYGGKRGGGGGKREGGEGGVG